MVMATKMAIASNNDNNHVDGEDSDNNDDHDYNCVKNGYNDNDADNNDEDEDNENGPGNGVNDEHTTTMNNDYKTMTSQKKHSLHVGWRNFFPSCAVVMTVFWFWREIGFVVTYLLRVQYSCGIVLVFWFLREIVL